MKKQLIPLLKRMIRSVGAPIWIFVLTLLCLGFFRTNDEEGSSQAPYSTQPAWYKAAGTREPERIIRSPYLDTTVDDQRDNKGNLKLVPALNPDVL